MRYDGQNGVWYTADFSGDGDVSAAAVAVDFVEPTTVPSTSSAGCEATDFQGVNVTGKVVKGQPGHRAGAAADASRLRKDHTISSGHETG